MAAGHISLMELVSNGIQANNADAPDRLTQLPSKGLLPRETTIDKRGQDSILGDVGCFSQDNVQNMERSK